MADVKIDMMLADSSGSIGKRTNETKALNTELTKTQKLSAKALAGGDGGAMTSQKVVEYGRSRATMGTGAEARDFAKQSEGLSGLVRLYAIYAANLYAAGAAFNALRDAANTETMIKGMDQLGARSGIAMGTLAKNFADAAGGAISLRESAEATTKAISSGLSQKQFLQLGQVALKASQALGINMSDAVSRLTRGITKLEPELLDELGIFAKIGPATEKYANELGKPVAALTDFERRQAFANAVLTEGIDKFGKLDLPTNPYDKLTASLKNLAQSALELVNKALLPLVNILSQSPTALTGILGLLGLNLIKQALPAIGQYREELKKTAETASDIAARKATESRSTRLAAFGGALQKADDLATQAEDRASKTWAKVEEAVKRSGSKVAESVKPALAKLISKDNILEVTPKELKVLDDLGTKNTKIATTYRQLALEIREAQRAAQEYFQAQKAKAAAEAKPLPFFSTAGINERIAKGAASRAERTGIVSRAVEESSVGGILSSFVQLKRETAASKDMGVVGKTMTIVSGAAGILTNGIVRLASSLGTAGMVVSILVGAFTALDGWLSKTGEQSEKFNKSVQDSTSAVKTYREALKIINEEGDPFKTEALSAASNAVRTLRDTFKDTTSTYLELQKAIDASAWDKFTNSIAGIFGRGASDTFAKAQINNLDALISSASRYGKEQELILVISEALGADKAQWAKKIAEDGPKAAAGLKKIQPEIEKIVVQYGNAEEASKKFDTSLKELRTEQQNLITSLQDQTTTGKFATKLLQFAIDFKGALNNSETAVSRLNSLLGEQKNLGLFSPETANGLMQITEQVTRINEENKKVNTTLEKQKNNLLDLQSEQAVLEAKAKSRIPLSNKEFQRYVTELPQAIQSAQAEVTRIEQQRAQLNAEVAKLMKDPRISKAITESFVKSTDYMTRELDITFRKAALSVKQSALSGLSGQAIPGIAEAQYKLDIEGINLQRAANATLEEIARVNALTLAVQTQALATSLAKESRGPGEGPTQFQTISENFFKAISGGKNQKAVIDEIKKYMPTAAPEETTALQSMIQSLLSSRGTLGKTVELDAQKRIADLNLILNKLQEEYNIKAKNIALDSSAIQSQLDVLGIREQTIGYLTQEQAVNKAILSDKRIELDYQSKLQKIELDRVTSIYRLAAAGELTEEKANALELLAIAERTNAQKERSNALVRTGVALTGDLAKKSEYDLQLINKRIQLDKLLVDIVQDRIALERASSLEFAELELELREKTVMMTEKQQKEERKLLEIRKLNQSTDDKILQARKDYNAKILEISQQSDAEYDPAAVAAANAADEALKTRIRLLEQERSKRLEILNVNEDILKDQLALKDIYQNTFSAMGDSIVEFVRTGKLSFKSLITDMLAQIAKLYVNRIFMNLFSSLLPGLPGMGSSFTGSSVGFGIPSGVPLAKGGVFTDAGIMKYAKGGTFTNSIVDKPTLFKFAKGTGLMGEAGPEAIMPLKRDSQGNLGVRGESGGNVEVVVNNYSTTQAETRETTDNRGNRRIEVVIGDLTAGQVTRSGSSTNRAIQGTFGIQPQLIRR